MSKISIKINNQSVSNWDSIVVSKSMQSFAGKFSFRVVSQSMEDMKEIFESQKPVEIFIDDTKIMTGYLFTLNPTLDMTSVIINISGAEKTSDLIDCSVMHTSGSWTKIGLKQLVQNICSPYNIAVTSNTDLGDIFPKFTTIQGELAFDAINRACAERSVLPMPNSDGELVLTNMSTELTHDSLRYGFNIMNASYTYDIRSRYSGYVYKSQYNKPGKGWSKKDISVYAEAYDENIIRNRVLEIRANDSITQKHAQKRINWEAQVRKGKSTNLSITVPDWFQTNGKLWENNKIVPVSIPDFSLNTELYISDIAYRLENMTRTTILNVVDPNIYAQKPVQKIKKTSPRKKNSDGWHL